MSCPLEIKVCSIGPKDFFQNIEVDVNFLMKYSTNESLGKIPTPSDPYYGPFDS